MTLDEHILEEEKLIRSFATIAYDTRLHDENGELMWKAEQYEKSQHEHEERKSFLEELKNLREKYKDISVAFSFSNNSVFCTTMELKKVKQDLNIYKEALVQACNEIRDRGCQYYECGSSYCKKNCELYLTCVNNNYEEHFLQKARKKNGD